MNEPILKAVGLKDEVFVLLLVFIAGNSVIQLYSGNNTAALVHITGMFFFVGGRLSAIPQLVDTMEDDEERGGGSEPTSVAAEE